MGRAGLDNGVLGLHHHGRIYPIVDANSGLNRAPGVVDLLPEQGCITNRRPRKKADAEEDELSSDEDDEAQEPEDDVGGSGAKYEPDSATPAAVRVQLLVIWPRRVMWYLSVCTRDHRLTFGALSRATSPLDHPSDYREDALHLSRRWHPELGSRLPTQVFGYCRAHRVNAMAPDRRDPKSKDSGRRSLRAVRFDDVPMMDPRVVELVLSTLPSLETLRLANCSCSLPTTPRTLIERSASTKRILLKKLGYRLAHRIKDAIVGRSSATGTLDSLPPPSRMRRPESREKVSGRSRRSHPIFSRKSHHYVQSNAEDGHGGVVANSTNTVATCHSELWIYMQSVAAIYLPPRLSHLKDTLMFQIMEPGVLKEVVAVPSHKPSQTLPRVYIS
ncbi:hypothetical protein C8035_v007928 [Colletotrichum spinosum]|uniref:Uncharacterized protein n=1 Tax=Colletotrichum spinosum TaxID=1347390 RepID=A0A4R8QBP0_9PEZI|nr:hypothetical protein C8035_v007928 [Colletotrichum spinosum]